MKKQNRLLNSNEFKAVMDHKKRIRTDSFTLFVKQNDLGRLRVGLSVSKKLGKAHVRVKIRRQIRACFNLLSIFDFNYDIVVIGNLGFLNHGFKENYEMLETALTKLIGKKEVKR